MTIRSAAKAVIVRDGEILLQCCVDESLGIAYYELPGGGQRPLETLEAAVLRECLEETGYHVEILRFFATGEEIIAIDSVCRDFPDHAHRVFHIFLCRIRDLPRELPSEADREQVDVRWFPIDQVQGLLLRPRTLAPALAPLLASGQAGYLGTSILDDLTR